MGKEYASEGPRDPFTAVELPEQDRQFRGIDTDTDRRSEDK